MQDTGRDKINNRLSARLRSNTGASLSVALLFFIVCAVVGSVILAAASSSMGRIKNLPQADQERYVLSSAAKLVAERFSNKDLFNQNGALGTTADAHQVYEDNNTLTSIARFTYWSVSLDNGIYYWKSKNSLPSENSSISGGAAVWPSDFDELLPQLPESSSDADWWSGNEALSKARDLSSFQDILAERVISNYWNEEVLKNRQVDNVIVPGWTRNQIPSNASWMYGQTIDSLKEDVDLKGTHFDLTINGKPDKSKVGVDIWMDPFLNLEIHIYPFNGGYISDQKKENNNASTENFDHAAMRYLVRIPARAGEVRYDKSTTKVENTGYKVVSWETKDDEGEFVSSADTTNIVLSSASQRYKDLQTKPSYNITHEADILETTIERRVDLEDFGWNEARIYTGASVSVQPGRITEKGYLNFNQAAD